MTVSMRVMSAGDEVPEAQLQLLVGMGRDTITGDPSAVRTSLLRPFQSGSRFA